jgi:hypothetical protein
MLARKRELLRGRSCSARTTNHVGLLARLRAQRSGAGESACSVPGRPAELCDWMIGEFASAFFAGNVTRVVAADVRSRQEPVAHTRRSFEPISGNRAVLERHGAPG